MVRGLFRASFVVVLLAVVVFGGAGSSVGVAAGRLSVNLGGVCVREGARDRVAGKQVVCVINAKKQLRWRLAKATTVRVVSGTTSTSIVSTSSTSSTSSSVPVSTTTIASSTTTSTSTTSTSTTSTSTTSTSTTSTSLGGDRTAPIVTLGRSTGSAGVATLTFTVTGNEPIRCSTLSGSEGVDFVFTRISRINSITQTTEDVCTISAQSTAEPGDTNPRESTLAAASTFSITDTAGNAQTTLSGSPQTIWVQRIARPVISLSATTETVNLNATMNGYTVTSSGGTIASYSLTGTLPAGVSFSTTTGRITGTPTATQAATTYTISATNISGSGTATFTLTVLQIPSCANGLAVCALGDTGPGGGIVFYVQAAGGTFSCGATLASTCKYLEAAPTNWNGAGGDPLRSWATGANRGALVEGADGTAIGSGYQNSLDIVAQTGNVAATSAAVLARSYTGGSKSDWHLPSYNELDQLWSQRARLGGITNGWYWSSSEHSAFGAKVLYIPDGSTNGVSDKNCECNPVRPIRAFG